MTIEQILTEIDKYLATEPENDARRLWAILAGIRGPDSEDQSLKKGTTVFVRSRAFPLAAARTNAAGFSTFGMLFKSDFPPRNVLLGYSHFENHIRFAYTALKEIGR